MFGNRRFQKAAQHKKKWKKTKKLLRAPDGDLERSGKGSYVIQSPQYQELSTAAAAAPLTTLKRSEVQNVDLANQVRGNRYLRHVDHRSW